MTEDALLHAVTRELTKAGLMASVEYPGFIRAVTESGEFWNVGTANGGWGMDRTNADGSEFYEAHDFPGSAGWADPVLIAGAVLSRIKAGNRGDGK